MWLLAITVVIAIVVIALTRGSFVELANVSVQALWLMVVGLGLQIALEFLELPKDQIETLGYGLLMLSYAFLLAFCLANLRTSGFGIIAVGIALNAVVIGLNLGMPTAAVGEDRNGQRIKKPVEQTVKHRPESDDDLLGFLGDKIVLPEPIDTVISAGDIVLSIGVLDFAYFASRRRRRRRSRTGQTRAVSAPRESSTRSSAPRTRPS